MSRGGKYHEFKLSKIFYPAELNPVPEIHWNNELVTQIANTSAKLTRLDEHSQSNSNIALANSMFMRIETIASCGLDNPTCSLEDLILYSIGAPTATPHSQVEVAHNYIGLMQNWEYMAPVTIEIVKGLHRQLFIKDRRLIHPGEWRRNNLTINSLDRQSFFPPPPNAIAMSMRDLEKFLEHPKVVSLLKVVLTLFQIIAIHPFADGNSRVARLLLMYLLVQTKTIRYPIVPFSDYLRRNKYDYIQHLEAFRNNDDLEGWLSFILSALEKSADQALEQIAQLEKLFLVHESKVVHIPNGLYALNFLKVLPIVKVQTLAQGLNCSFLTAQRVITELESINLLSEITGNKRNRLYAYQPYLQFWKEIEKRPPNLVKPLSIPKEKIFWTPAVRQSLEQLRQSFLGAGLVEKKWELTSDTPFLDGHFSLAPIDLFVTFGILDEDKEIVVCPKAKHSCHFSKRGPYILLQASIEGDEQRSWGFALERKGQTIKWDTFWDEAESISVNEVAKICLNEFFKLTAARGIAVAKDSNRSHELLGKEKLKAMFMTLRDALGRKTEGEIFWEDDSTGADLIYHYSNVRFSLYFSVIEIIGFTANEHLEQRLRERMIENISALPKPLIKKEIDRI